MAHDRKSCSALAMLGAVSLLLHKAAFCGFSTKPLSARTDVHSVITRRVTRVRKLGAKFLSPDDVNVEDFYNETVNGNGGFPVGIERDLITRDFGDGDNCGNGDHEAAFKTLKEQMVAGEPFVGKDDGRGWIWLVADMHNTKGLQLHLRKEIPIGKRPLLVAKQDKVLEMFDNLDWTTARRRLNEILGGRLELQRKLR